GTRTFPDRFHSHGDQFASYRLAQPLGYWNALGLLATLGLVVALGFVAHARRTRMSVAAAASVPLVATTLYFTFSRGGWGALGGGLAAPVWLDPGGLRFLWCGLVVAVPAALCVASASRQDALTTLGSPPGEALRQGHRLAVVVVAATAASCVAAWGAGVVARRVRFSRRSARGADVALACLAVGSIVAVLVAGGGPPPGLSAVTCPF